MYLAPSDRFPDVDCHLRQSSLLPAFCCTKVTVVQSQALEEVQLVLVSNSKAHLLPPLEQAAAETEPSVAYWPIT